MYSPRTRLCALIFLAACGGGASPAAPMVEATSADAAAPPACPDEPAVAPPTLASPGDLDTVEKEESQLGALHSGSPEWTAKVNDLHNRYARLRTKAMIDQMTSTSCQLTLLKERAQAGEARMAKLVPAQ